jgi:Phospholipase_D-nuclease N-terminal
MADTGPRVHTNSILPTALLALVVIFVPILGHIILTPIILSDDLPTSHKIAWLLIVWILWGVGPFLYLLLGQRRNRLFSWGARPSDTYRSTTQPRDPMVSPTDRTIQY